MLSQCYRPRSSMRSALTGGLFISTDGSRRVVPDHWLTHAELLNESRLLRLSYSFCTIEVSGQCLDPIFDDAGASRLGAVLAVASDSAPNGQLWVTDIVIIAPSEQRAPEFEQECSNA